MMEDTREQTLAHLHLVAAFPGYWELRGLQRTNNGRMLYRGSFFVIATPAGGNLIYDRLEQAADWAQRQDRNGVELFIGMNPREHEARDKASVARLTACYVDVDFPDGTELGDALEQVTAGETPLPSFVVDSGYGLHVAYLLKEAERDKPLWRGVQRGLVQRFSELGADPKVAPDESRVLRLVPFANRKRWPSGVPTRILYESECRYSLEELAAAVAPAGGTAFSRNEDIAAVPEPFIEERGTHETAIALDGEAMQELVERAEGARFVFESWVKRNLRPGIHYGTFPVDGQEIPRPTLLKPGAELVAILFNWRFHFAADLDSLQMYGLAPAGAFAYVCHVIDTDGRTVGQGRGVAELRETAMNNANKTVKMAQKRAMVDAILRCAGLSQWFTQDLDEPLFIAPEASSTATPGEVAGNGNLRHGEALCTPAQCRDIRVLLKIVRRSEAEVLSHYGVGRLEDLSSSIAEKVAQRLLELRRGEAG